MAKARMRRGAVAGVSHVRSRSRVRGRVSRGAGVEPGGARPVPEMWLSGSWAKDEVLRATSRGRGDLPARVRGICLGNGAKLRSPWTVTSDEKSCRNPIEGVVRLCYVGGLKPG